MPVRTTVLLRYAHGPGQAHAGLCVTVILAVKRHGFEFISHRLGKFRPLLVSHRHDGGCKFKYSIKSARTKG